MFRCPIHGHVCLADGSVQSGVAKEHPEWLIVLDGKLYFGNPPPPKDPRMTERNGRALDAAATGASPTQPPMATPELLWR